MLAVTSPYQQFFDLDGSPLDGGYVYLGIVGANPMLMANQIPIFWDAAGTQPAYQPVKTLNGYLYRSGSPGTIFADKAYSIAIYDKRSKLVAYSPDAQAGSGFSVGIDLADPSKGAAMVAYQAPGVGTVPENLKDKADEIRSVKGYGAKGNGADYDHVAIQKNATDCDANKLPYMFLPTNTENYLINAPIVFNDPGVKIFGMKGATYNRGGGKNGNIVIGPDAAYALDLGNGRTGGNPADNWAVSNIGFKQAAGIALRTKDGIRFTSKTDGPDRGATIREVSSVSLNKAISIPDPGKSTALATLVVENCCLSNNNYALHAEGNVLGLRFVGNQAEQNSVGAIHGTFNGPIYIADNMLEGQGNVINITVPPITGNRPRMVVERNYFERNGGDYVISFTSSTSNSSLVVGSNYILFLDAKDYLIIKGAGSVLLTLTDEYPVTFDGGATIQYGSTFLNRQMTYYKVRGFGNGGVGARAIIKEFANLVDAGAANTHVRFNTGDFVPSPYGPVQCAPAGNGFINIPMAVVAGDLYVINVLCQLAAPFSADLNIQVYDSTRTILVNGVAATLIDQELNGNWALVSMSFRAGVSSASLGFRFYSAVAQTTRNVAGIAARNYGQIAEDKSQAITVYPVVPNVLPKSFAGSAVYNPPSLADGASATTTVAAIGAAPGDFASAGFSVNTAGVTMTAWVSAADTVSVKFENRTGAIVDLASGTLRVKVQQA